MKIWFAGDWHGDLGAIKRHLQILAKHDTATHVIHVGDLGIGSWGQATPRQKEINKLLKEYGISLLVNLGNHDDHDLYDKVFAADSSTPLQIESNITLIPRGYVEEREGTIIGFLPGAFSVDRAYRKEGISWWPQEQVRFEDLQTLEKNLASRKLDILVSHDCPRTLALKLAYSPLPDYLELESAKSQKIIEEAVMRFSPTYNIHGHWHIYHESTLGDTKLITLAQQGMQGNIICLDTSMTEDCSKNCVKTF